MQESNEVFLSKKSHLINLLKGAQPMKETSKSYPLLFLNIIIGKQTLFLREFCEGIIDQDYPKEQIQINIIHEDKSNLGKLNDCFKNVKNKYGEFKEFYEKDIVKLRLKMLKSTTAEFILHMHSSIILTSESTISDLVAQDLPLVGPKIKTNQHHPTLKQFCQATWQNKTETLDKELPFPPLSSASWENRPERFLVSNNTYKFLIRHTNDNDLTERKQLCFLRNHN